MLWYHKCFKSLTRSYFLARLSSIEKNRTCKSTKNFRWFIRYEKCVAFKYRNLYFFKQCHVYIFPNHIFSRTNVYYSIFTRSIILWRILHNIYWLTSILHRQLTQLRNTNNYCFRIAITLWCTSTLPYLYKIVWNKVSLKFSLCEKLLSRKIYIIE